jgi:hypothetical protein
MSDMSELMEAVDRLPRHPLDSGDFWIEWLYEAEYQVCDHPAHARRISVSAYDGVPSLYCGICERFLG